MPNQSASEEAKAALAAQICQNVIDDDEYETNFRNLNISKFRKQMDHRNKPEFQGIAVAHVLGVLCAKGDKIATGLTYEEFKANSRDLSDEWISLATFGQLIYPENEAIHRNPFNFLRQSIFDGIVECVDLERYKMQITGENRDVLNMMIEGARNKKNKKEYDDEKRDAENELPVNKARYMQGCNFLHGLIAITCDELCMEKVLWSEVIKVYSKLGESFLTRDQHANNPDILKKAHLYEKYNKELGLDQHPTMNQQLTKHITGRKKLQQALCETVFCDHFTITKTDASGGFSVQIEGIIIPYSKKQIDDMLARSNYSSTRYSPRTDKRKHKMTKEQEELEKRKAHYSPKYAADRLEEQPSTSFAKAGPSKLTDWDGINTLRDITDDEQTEIGSRSGLAPEKVNQKKEPTSVQTPYENAQESSDSDIRHDGDFSSADELDADKDNGYSDEENHDQRPKKNISKSVTKPVNKHQASDHDAQSRYNRADEAETSRTSTSVPKRIPFARPEYSDEEDEEESTSDETEHETSDTAEESMETNELVPPADEYSFDVLDSESDINVFHDLQRIVRSMQSNEGSHSQQGRSINHQPLENNERVPYHKQPKPVQIVDAGPSLTSQRRPQVPHEMHPDHIGQKQKEADRAREIQRKEAEEKQRREEEAKRVQEELEKRQFEEYLERVRQLEADEEFAKKLQRELDIESNRGGIRKQSNQTVHGGNNQADERSRSQASRSPHDDHGAQSHEDQFNRHRPMNSPGSSRAYNNNQESYGQTGVQPPHRGSPVNSDIHNLGAGNSSQHGRPSSASTCNPNFACNIPRNILMELANDASFDTNNALLTVKEIDQNLQLYPVDTNSYQPFQSEQVPDVPYRNPNNYEYSRQGLSSGNRPYSPDSSIYAGSHVSRRPEYHNGINGENSYYGEQRPAAGRPLSRNGFEEYARGSSMRNFPMNPSYNGYNTRSAPRPTRYDVQPADYQIERVQSRYMSSNNVNTVNGQRKAFIDFVKSYLEMFGRPDSEIQLSTILKRCRSFDSSFRYDNPHALFGPSFVDQLREVLPKYIAVNTLAAINEVIFFINPAIYPRFEMFHASAKCEIFIDFVHKFLLAFDSAISLKWSRLREGIIWEFGNPDSYFGVPWIHHFNDYAAYVGIPVFAEKPFLNEIYLSIRDYSNR